MGTGQPSSHFAVASCIWTSGRQPRVRRAGSARPPGRKPRAYSQHEQPDPSPEASTDASVPSTIQPIPAWTGGPTADDLVLSARLDGEVRAASAAQARVQLLSVKIAAEGVLRQLPDAAYLQLDHSDEEYGALVPAAVLDAQGTGARRRHGAERCRRS